MTNLQELREIIIKANNPIGFKAETAEDWGTDKQYQEELKKPIDLAMVLIALDLDDDKKTCSVMGNVVKFQIYGLYAEDFWEYCIWDLTKDLDHQDPQTILNLLTLLKQK